ncbi:MAG TPA: tellurite resistance TerB family protein [Polyangiaceae bacterium]|nr:tellurite resistance TerB family protein [Polyangiaceae bacterium]
MPIPAVLERARAMLEKKVEGEVLSFGLVRASFYETQSTADEFFSALVEGAFLVASADGLLSDEETHTLAETINFVAGERLSADDFSAMLNSFAEVLGDDGEEGRIRTLAEAIPDEAARHEILRFAILIALCDGELSGREHNTLLALGAAFGFEGTWVDDTIGRLASLLQDPAQRAAVLSSLPPQSGGPN